MENTNINQYVQKCTETEDFVSFKSECGCYAHDLNVFFEIDENYTQLVLIDDVYLGEEYVNKFGENHLLFKRLLYRLKLALTILFKGSVKVEHGFVFKGSDHMKQFVDYINYGYNKVKK